MLRSLAAATLAVALTATPAAATGSTTPAGPGAPSAAAPLAGSTAPDGSANEDLLEIALDEVDAAGESEPDVLAAPATSGGASPAEAPATEADAADGDPVLDALTAPVPVEGRELAMVGVTWRSAPEGVAVDVRARVDGAWEPWARVDLDLGARSSDAGPEGEVRGGSDPYLVVGAEEVQVRLVLPEGSDPVEDPRLFVHASDPRAEDATVSLAQSPGTVAATTAGTTSASSADGTLAASPRLEGYPAGSYVHAEAPAIAPRSSWGARPPSGIFDPAVVKGVVVHHTAGSNSYTQDQVPAILRSIQAYHMDARGWYDVGYNLLVDKWGRVWEGREGGATAAPIQGVHASGYNATSAGVSVMGNYVDVDPSWAVRESLARVIAWRLAAANVLADGGGFDGAFGTVIGHRDVAATACPGRIQNYLGSITTRARALQTVYQALPTDRHLDRDLDGDGRAEVVQWSTDGAFAASVSPEPYETGRVVDTGWGDVDLAAFHPTGPDDRATDLLARLSATGELYAYHRAGADSFDGRTRLGPGWQKMSHVAPVGDINGDGYDDVVAVRASNARLYFYPGLPGSLLGRGVDVGGGWHIMANIAGAGDMTGDGIPDLLALTTSDELRVYPGTGTVGFGLGIPIGKVGTDADRVLGVGDLNGDGHRDAVVGLATGRMRPYLGDGTGALRPAEAFGSGWHKMPLVAPVQGWAAPGDTGLLAISRTGALRHYAGRPAGALEAWRPLPVPTQDVDALTVLGDLVGDGTADVLTRTTDGRVLLHSTDRIGTWQAPRQVAEGWDGLDLLVGAGDADADGVPDVLVRDAASGDLTVHPMRRDGSFGESWLVATGVRGDAVPVGGWTDDSSADVLVVDDRGTARLLSLTDGAGYASVTVGTIRAGDTLVGVGDFRSTGNNDVLALGGDGRFWLYPGTGTLTLGPRTAVSGTAPMTTGGVA